MKRILLLATICIMTVSCTQDVVMSLYSDVPTVHFGPDGGNFNMVLFTNGSSWTATCDDPAVTFSPTSGSYTTPMHVAVKDNPEHFTKAIPIKFTSTLDDKSKTYNVVITQDCNPFVIAEEDTQRIGAEGGVVRFVVNSNKPWIVDTPTGIALPYTIDPMQGGPNRTTISVTVAPNNSGTERVLPFYVVLDGFSGSSARVLLMVIQAA